MDIGDSGEFARRLNTLAELFDTQLSAARKALYFEALRDLSFETVARALNQSAKVCTFFPKPAELRKLAVGDSEDAAEIAWMALKTAMREAGSYSSLVTDATLGEAITAVFGSWPQACALDLSPEMWASKRKEFGRVYRVLADRGLEGNRYLFGIAETQNAGKREWLSYVPVARLESGHVTRLTLEEADTERERIAAVSHGWARLSGTEALAIVPPAAEESA